MTEKLEVFDLEGKSLGAQDRSEFYTEIKKEFREKGIISKKVKAVRILLLNSEGKIYLQKRSKSKTENSGLYDKTVGGHVSFDESWNIAAIRECAEELGFPMAILSDEEFNKAIETTNLSIIGIFRKVDEIDNFESIRISSNGEKFIQPFISTFYIGYYNGAIRFIDGESSGIEVFSLEELIEDIKINPAKFTEDIKFMILNYKQYLKPIKK